MREACEMELVHLGNRIGDTLVCDRNAVCRNHNDTNIQRRYYGPAHTDSDVSVLFEEADILHVGDTWWNGIYPFIDYSTDGSIDGMIQATERNLHAVTDKTIVIPGHGPVGNRSALAEYRDMLTTIRNNIATLKKQGKSLSETIALKPTADYDAKFGQFLITPAFFTTLSHLLFLRPLCIPEFSPDRCRGSARGCRLRTSRTAAM